MANFVIIVDADTERREQFMRTITPQIAPVDGLRISSCASGDFQAVWAAHESAPISQIADSDGAAVIWGDAIPGKGFGRIDARQLRKLWRNPTAHLPEAFDGYHAAAAYRPDTGLVVGADLLGIFPIYYFATEEVLLVGSSPELFRQHPLSRAELDMEGLAGILLIMHSVGGRTMLRDVQRLASGHLLQWRRGASVTELPQYDIPCSDCYFDLPLSAHLEIVDRAIDEALSRHVPEDARHSLLLSGGLDSRMMGGYLKRKGRRDIVALSLGQPTDLEMRCAVPVARELGFEHHSADPPFGEYPAFADLHAKWQHGVNGFNQIMQWADHRALRQLPSRIVTGHLGNPILGGSHIPKAYRPDEMRFSFDLPFACANEWGVPYESLKKLLRPEIFGDLLEENVRRLRADYEHPAGRGSHQAWHFELYNRSRYHVGINLWMLTFGAWPVTPLIDRNLLECIGGIPTASLADRLLQNELLATRFPALATLPLERNLYDTFPLRPRFRWLLGWHLFGRPLHEMRVRLHRGEQRYYHRVYDINNPGWMGVRRAAEPLRDRVAHLFNMDVLAELLPPPDAHIDLKDGLGDASGMKTLLGLLLWSKEHLN